MKAWRVQHSRTVLTGSRLTILMVLIAFINQFRIRHLIQTQNYEFVVFKRVDGLSVKIFKCLTEDTTHTQIQQLTKRWHYENKSMIRHKTSLECTAIIYVACRVDLASWRGHPSRFRPKTTTLSFAPSDIVDNFVVTSFFWRCTPFWDVLMALSTVWHILFLMFHYWNVCTNIFWWLRQ